MKINRFPLFALVISLLALCACKHEKPYTITGTLDLPAQIPYGDTIIDVPSFNDTWVYLLDFDNQLLDSALIADNAFHFEGTVDNRQPYYVQFVSQLGSTLLVIEPGDIEVYIPSSPTACVAKAVRRCPRICRCRLPSSSARR